MKKTRYWLDKSLCERTQSLNAPVSDSLHAVDCLVKSWSNRRLTAVPPRQLRSEVMPSGAVGNLKTVSGTHVSANASLI